MSAIWGVVSLEENRTVPVHAREVFETEYGKCKLDECRGIEGRDAYFGCGIQHITPQSVKEVLPKKDGDKLLFTADCVLDNRMDVIELLCGHGYEKKALEEMADGSLMFLAYRIWGKQCVTHFRGLFSMAVWDAGKRSLTLWSDHVSGRCLYYVQQGNLVAFSTLMEPLVKLFPGLSKNSNYAKDFLLVNPSVIYVVPGETPYQEISLMLPAAEVEFDTNGKKEHRYWNIGDAVSGYSGFGKSFRKPKNYQERFLQIYRESVKDALVSVGEVGIAMSSGLDSSSVGVLAAEELAKQGKELYSYTFVPWNTRTATEEGNALYDESGYVEKIADRYKNIRTEFLNNRGKNLFEDMDFCMGLLELPYKTGTFPNHYEMCQKGARAGCKVFLNGGFGNNTVSFGEINHVLYDLYRKKRYGRLALWLYRFCRHESMGCKSTAVQLLRSYRKYDERDKDTRKPFVPANPYLRQEILKGYSLEKRFLADKRLMLSDSYLDGNRYKNYLTATALLVYLGVFETKFGLHTGMLLRDPTKDVRVLNFCHELPYSFFAYGGTPRWLIRSGFRGRLPEELLNRWRQRGVLNIDWLDRIYRDWDKLKPELLRALPEEDADWLDVRKVKEDIETLGTNREKDSYVLTHLCAIVAVRRFVNKK